MKVTIYITMIEVDASAAQIYDGPRVTACSTRAEAEQDALEWITEYADGDDAFTGHLDNAEDAMQRYAEYTCHRANIQEQVIELDAVTA